jgi:hypothetical protein
VLRKLAERHVDSPRQMTGWRYEFFTLPHVDNDKRPAGCKPVLKFHRLDPSRFLRTEAAEQS